MKLENLTSGASVRGILPDAAVTVTKPLADVDSEAIDFGAASQCFAKRRALRRTDLETLGLA